MATATETQRRAMNVLETVTLMLRDLDEIAREWDQISEGERVMWSTDWSNEMSGLELVSQHLAEGLLGETHGRRYREIIRRLSDARPLLDHLGLYQPSLAYESLDRAV